MIPPNVKRGLKKYKTRMHHHGIEIFLVTFGIFVLLSFATEIPESNAQGGSPSEDCSMNLCENKDFRRVPYLTGGCKETTMPAEKIKDGRKGKDCKVKVKVTTCTGKCTGVGNMCEAKVGVDTCNGKTDKKPDMPKDMPPKEMPKGEMPKEGMPMGMPMLPPLMPPTSMPKDMPPPMPQKDCAANPNDSECTKADSVFNKIIEGVNEFAEGPVGEVAKKFGIDIGPVVTAAGNAAEAVAETVEDVKEVAADVRENVVNYFSNASQGASQEPVQNAENEGSAFTQPENTFGQPVSAGDTSASGASNSTVAEYLNNVKTWLQGWLSVL